MKGILLAALFSCTFIFSQNTPEILADSTSVIGMINEKTVLGESVNYDCNIGSDREIDLKEFVFVCGVKSCKSYMGETKDFYQVIFNNKEYFVEKNKIKVLKDWYFDAIKNFNAEESLTFFLNAKSRANNFYTDKSIKVLDNIMKNSSKGLYVLNWTHYDESDYTKGTGLKIKVLNPSKKTIKYVWFSFVGYNAVDDLVIDPISGKKTQLLKGVGPIKPETTASFEYEYVWHTDLVEKVKLTLIKVQFIDGTFNTIENPSLVTMNKKDFELLEDLATSEQK